MTYRLDRHAREHYDAFLETDPPIAVWEASFDKGQTWVAGEAVPDEPGWYRWLIAGDLCELGGADAQLTPGSHVPKARAVSNPEIVVRNLEEIRVK